MSNNQSNKQPDVLRVGKQARILAPNGSVYEAEIADIKPTFATTGHDGEVDDRPVGMVVLYKMKWVGREAEFAP